ncbi:MAG: nitrilase-related carbon-nitrogen hydrolase, partial [Streptosporangiaceae bacterium]
MHQLRIALAQVNATVGDLDGNAAAIEQWTARAARAGAAVVVFPEMMLTGYPVEDLALRASFVSASVAELRAVAARLAGAGLGGVAVVTGYLDRQAGLQARVGLPAGAPRDAAAVLFGGEVVVTSAKHHLPNYGVFDEYRYFVPGDVLPVVRLTTGPGEQADVAVAICEDLWQEGGPVSVARQAGASVLVVPNASPYEEGKSEARLALCQRRAAEAGCPLAYVNLIGGQDELVFDGDSIIVGQDGAVLARGPQFAEALVLADVDVAAAGQEPAGDVSTDALDGTTMTIRRIELAGRPVPQPAGTSADAELAGRIW